MKGTNKGANAVAFDWNDPTVHAIRRDMMRFAQLQLRDADRKSVV